MRRFTLRRVTGPINPQALVTGLLPGPQRSRVLFYSVMVHMSLFSLLMFYNFLNLSFRRPAPIVYRVNYVQLGSGGPKSSGQKSAKLNPVKSQPKEKPAPKPKPEVPKPAPKPAVEKKPAVTPEKKVVEVAKVAKAPEPKKNPAEIKRPVVTSKEEKTPPPLPLPPEPEPEPMQVARAAEPGAMDDDPNTVDINATGGQTGSNINPELGWYVETIRRKVWQSWIVPMHALAPGAHARVVIRFEIKRDGSVESTPQVFESSSISLLDQSGYGAVIRAAPFPPLPESFRGDTLGVRFGFEYGERV